MTKFQTGDSVQISSRTESRHHRVPAYAKGHTGVIKQVLSPQGVPEALAYEKHSNEKVTVYRVNLKQTDLWSNYAGSSQDSLEVEVYEHWLESAGTGANP